jgi:hypothetical protein
MTEYRIERGEVLGPTEGSYWSAIFGVYQDDRRVLDVVVKLPFRTLGVLSAVLRDSGVERHTAEIASAVVSTWGEKMIRDQLRLRGECDREIVLESRLLAESGKAEAILREAGLL